MIAISLISFYLLQVVSAQFICNETLPQGLTKAMEEAVEPFKLIAAPFKVGDYNIKLLTYYTEDQAAGMGLAYGNDTIAFVFAYNASNQPSQSDFVTGILLPAIINKLRGCIEATTLGYIGANDWNFETSLPVVHVQTAGHVSGQAYFYHPKMIKNPPAEWTGKKIYGTSYHAIYEENIWYQGVVILTGLQDSDYITNVAENVIGSEEDIINMLNRVNAAFAAFGKK